MKELKAVEILTVMQRVDDVSTRQMQKEINEALAELQVLFINEAISFEKDNKEHYFRTHQYQEVPADLFIRTKGTCEENELCSSEESKTIREALVASSAYDFNDFEFAEVEDNPFIRTNGTCEEEVTEPQDKTEQAHRQSENLDSILTERGVVYGDYGVHVDAVGDIMNILQNVCEKKNKCKMGTKVQAMNFYVVSKLVRLAATTIHEDSLKDAINYLKLMYKEIHGKEIQ